MSDLNGFPDSLITALVDVAKLLEEEKYPDAMELVIDLSQTSRRAPWQLLFLIPSLLKYVVDEVSGGAPSFSFPIYRKDASQAGFFAGQLLTSCLNDDKAGLSSICCAVIDEVNRHTEEGDPKEGISLLYSIYGQMLTVIQSYWGNARKTPPKTAPVPGLGWLARLPSYDN